MKLAIPTLLLGAATGLCAQSVIRVNLLGYTPLGSKVAVYGDKAGSRFTEFRLMDSATSKAVFAGKPGVWFGAYGPFKESARLNLTAFSKPGTYYLEAGKARSPYFRIGNDVYRSAADFCLRYMRQQRSGFNPYLRDSCHTQDGYTMYGPMPDSTRIDASGGWHDASDYLQYVTTSANATYHLLAAWRDFPEVFGDAHAANGLPGRNGMPDVADEARWGLDWLIKMHPTKDWMFHQLADDRDHISMRMPGLDSQYGRGYQRPVYFVTGKPQGFFKYQNRSTGAANIAGKFSSAFALGCQLLQPVDGAYAQRLRERAFNAYQWGMKKPGVCQTAPGRAPYFYEEGNWADDMELAAASLYNLSGDNKYAADAGRFADMEKHTPWLGADTARHYQWYPFVNVGHYELAKISNQNPRLPDQTQAYLKQGIEKVWAKARTNAFYRGVPFIWCSNNLTTSFSTQCYWYRTVSGDNTYQELEQANFDWLFGCNPWGTSMVYGLPWWGDTPVDPHSAFTHIKKYPIDGGLVDGPVYTNIFKGLIGLTLYNTDSYADWQSDLAVYHDDYGDYSTNEPTMDGTASLIYLLAAKEHENLRLLPNGMHIDRGAVIRADSSQKKMAIIFTGHEYADGGKYITQVLQKEKVKASFFLTGDFIRAFPSLVKQLRAEGHFVGPHSHEHLLYASWHNRDSLYITRNEFGQDLQKNYDMLKPLGITPQNTPIFLPPYEWYNDTIACWTNEQGVLLVNNTPGTLSAADYTTPDMRNYRSSDTIYQSIIHKAKEMPFGLNGYLLLMHVGTDPARTDKFYNLLPLLIQELRGMGYSMVRVDELLGIKPAPVPVSKPPATKGKAKKKRKR
jgi:peptidoglycan/xylan/chitin deacetylase (PgdA/CDA1 family)